MTGNPRRKVLPQSANNVSAARRQRRSSEEDCAHLSASSQQLQRRRWHWQHRLSRPRETNERVNIVFKNKKATTTKKYV